ncbi:MAG: LacI family transcriptional regulator [Betaproteobacteria bacterium]|nr:LacI family transcriptional regulator [Betaproteobacteria bacterium]
MKSRRRLISIFAALLPLAAAAADYPAKPIRVVVPWPAGGSTDTLARIIGQRLTTLVNQPVVIDNRAGATGTIGVDMVAKSIGDGYTITIVEAAHVVMPATTARLPYDLARDFAPLTLIGVSPQIIFVNAALPAKNLKDFIAMAKAKPGEIGAAHTGPGSFTHLSLELLQSRSGTKFNQVGYKGAAPAMIELAGGQVQLGIFTLASAAGTIKSGRITPVAIAGDKRLDALPDVPTTGELGMKDLVINQWWGYVAPASVPAGIVARLNKDLVATLDHPSVRERVNELAVDVRTTTPAQLKTLIGTELLRWAAIAREAGIKPE